MASRLLDRRSVHETNEPMRPSVPAGTAIARFRVCRLIGRGGMADVYSAVDLQTGDPVALKLLAPAYGVGPFEERFRRETSNAARLDHPGCVHLIDHGVAQDGTLYLAMELLTGRTLRGELEAAGKFSVGHATRVIGQLLDGLAHAHAAGVLHRDVKPENIMTRRAAPPPPPVRVRRGDPPAVVLIDFGLSALADDARVTAAGTCIGSPSYLAPERFLERDYDERADVYAAGVILYELLAGAPPFTGATPAEIARQHIEREPVPIARLRPDVPAGLAALVHRALAKDPDDRFVNAGHMLAELRTLPPPSTARYPIVSPGSFAPANSGSPPAAEPSAEPTIPLSTRSITFIREPVWRRMRRWLVRFARPRALAAGRR